MRSGQAECPAEQYGERPGQSQGGRLQAEGAHQPSAAQEEGRRGGVLEQRGGHQQRHPALAVLQSPAADRRVEAEEAEAGERPDGGQRGQHGGPHAHLPPHRLAEQGRAGRCRGGRR